MKAPISVCILTKNEEKNIGICIQSVIHLVQEVIILDTGSTDETIKLAVNEGATVKQGTWKEHFGEARNELITLATQPYILMIDADERLINTDLEDLQYSLSLLEHSPESTGLIEVQNIIGNRVSSTQISRLFPNNQNFKYSGRVHEQILVNGQIPNKLTTKIVLEHTGYDTQIKESKNKVERNLQLLFCELVEHPNEPYILFQIGRTLSVDKQYKEARKYLESAHKLLQVQPSSYYSSVIHSLAGVYLRLSHWEELMPLLDYAINTFPDYTDLYYIYGSALIEMKSIEAFKMVPDVFNKCIELGEASTERYETEKGVGTFLSHYNLGVYYELVSEMEKAKYHYSKSMSHGFKPAESRLAQLS